MEQISYLCVCLFFFHCEFLHTFDISLVDLFIAQFIHLFIFFGRENDENEVNIKKIESLAADKHHRCGTN